MTLGEHSPPPKRGCCQWGPVPCNDHKRWRKQSGI